MNKDANESIHIALSDGDHLYVIQNENKKIKDDRKTFLHADHNYMYNAVERFNNRLHLLFYDCTKANEI